MNDDMAGHMNRMDRLGRYIFGSLWIYFAYKCFASGLYPPVFVWLPVCLGLYAWMSATKGICPVYRAFKTYS